MQLAQDGPQIPHRAVVRDRWQPVARDTRYGGRLQACAVRRLRPVDHGSARQPGPRQPLHPVPLRSQVRDPRRPAVLGEYLPAPVHGGVRLTDLNLRPAVDHADTTFDESRTISCQGKSKTSPGAPSRSVNRPTMMRDRASLKPTGPTVDSDGSRCSPSGVLPTPTIARSRGTSIRSRCAARTAAIAAKSVVQ